MVHSGVVPYALERCYSSTATAAQKSAQARRMESPTVKPCTHALASRSAPSARGSISGIG